MPDGIDTQYGINYQNLVGVIRVLEFLSRDDLLSIEFESESDILEDINIEYNSHFILEQVKKREHSVWNKSSIKSILRKFIEELHNSKYPKKIKFRFTTGASWDSGITKLMNIQNKLLKFEEITDEEVTMLTQLVDPKYEIETIKDLIRKVDFVWNYHAPNHPSMPFAAIMDACKSILSGYRAVKGDHEELICKIVLQIIEFSSSKIRNKYTASDFERVSGIPAYNNDYLYIEEQLGYEYLSVIKNNNPKLIRNNLTQTIGGMKFTIPIYFEIQNHAIAFWLIDMDMPDEAFFKIQHYIDNLQNMRHFVLSIEKNQEYDSSQYNFNEELLINDPTDLQTKLDEIIR